eukprot:gb/GEZN01014648.1/.p1 GENE.gb/GEZN01014648.1/~~gb/GEZN01014648.1/.p1  ORF type:complete len:214 (-),score=28.10 gb/GEZN01014648.1/:177-818(-)
MTNTILQCLRPGQWLNDEVMNFYMAMINERSQELVKKYGPSAPPHVLKIYCHNSFFCDKMTNGGKGYKYQAVKRWSKKAGVKIAEQDKVIFPVHVHGNHWCCGVINFLQKRFEYYDSLGGRNALCLSSMRKYVVDEAKTYSGNKGFNLEEWTDYVPSRDEIPQQANCCDCGVFTLKFADYLSQDLPLAFSQENMPYFRKRTVNDILKTSLRVI